MQLFEAAEQRTTTVDKGILNVRCFPRCLQALKRTTAAWKSFHLTSWLQFHVTRLNSRVTTNSVAHYKGLGRSYTPVFCRRGLLKMDLHVDSFSVATTHWLLLLISQFQPMDSVRYCYHVNVDGKTTTGWEKLWSDGKKGCLL